jgi:hypothetical protein
MSAPEGFGQALWRRHTQTAVTTQARAGARATFGETVYAGHARFAEMLMRRAGGRAQAGGAQTVFVVARRATAVRDSGSAPLADAEGDDAPAAPHATVTIDGDVSRPPDAIPMTTPMHTRSSVVARQIGTPGASVSAHAVPPETDAQTCDAGDASALADQAPAVVAADIAHTSGTAAGYVAQPLVGAATVVARQMYERGAGQLLSEGGASNPSFTTSPALATGASGAGALAFAPGDSVSALPRPLIHRKPDARVEASPLSAMSAFVGMGSRHTSAPRVADDVGPGTSPTPSALTPIAAALDIARAVTPVAMQYTDALNGIARESTERGRYGEASPLAEASRASFRSVSAAMPAAHSSITAQAKHIDSSSGLPFKATMRLPHAERVASAALPSTAEEGSNASNVSNVMRSAEHVASTWVMPLNLQSMTVSAAQGRASTASLPLATMISRSHAAWPEHGAVPIASAGVTRPEGIKLPPAAVSAIDRAVALPFAVRPLSRAMQSASTLTPWNVASSFVTSASVARQASPEAHAVAVPDLQHRQPVVATSEGAGIMARELRAPTDVVAERESTRITSAGTGESAAAHADRIAEAASGDLVTPTLPTPHAAPVDLPLQHGPHPTTNTPHDAGIARTIDAADTSHIECSPAEAGASNASHAVLTGASSAKDASTASTAWMAARNALSTPVPRPGVMRKGRDEANDAPIPARAIALSPAAAVAREAFAQRIARTKATTPDAIPHRTEATPPPPPQHEPAPPSLSRAPVPSFAVKAQLAPQAASRFPLLVQRDARTSRGDGASAASWIDRATAHANAAGETVSIDRIAEQYGVVSPASPIMRDVAPGAWLATPPAAAPVTSVSAVTTTSTLAPAAPAANAAATDPDELAERAWRLILDRLAIEQERRGYTTWA